MAHEHPSESSVSVDNQAERLVILRGLVTAVDYRTWVLELVADAEDHDAAADRLTAELGVEPLAARAIVRTQLGWFSRRAAAALRIELAELEKQLTEKGPGEVFR